MDKDKLQQTCILVEMAITHLLILTKHSGYFTHKLVILSHQILGNINLHVIVNTTGILIVNFNPH